MLLEPSTIVTYRFPGRGNPFTRAELKFFAPRGSPAWQHKGFEHFQAKWSLHSDPYFDKVERIGLALGRRNCQDVGGSDPSCSAQLSLSHDSAQGFDHGANPSEQRGGSNPSGAITVI